VGLEITQFACLRGATWLLKFEVQFYELCSFFRTRDLRNDLTLKEASLLPHGCFSCFFSISTESGGWRYLVSLPQSFVHRGPAAPPSRWPRKVADRASFWGCVFPLWLLPDKYLSLLHWSCDTSGLAEDPMESGLQKATFNCNFNGMFMCVCMHVCIFPH
jgi:hypothetical protein